MNSRFIFSVIYAPKTTTPHIQTVIPKPLFDSHNLTPSDPSLYPLLEVSSVSPVIGVPTFTLPYNRFDSIVHLFYCSCKSNFYLIGFWFVRSIVQCRYIICTLFFLCTCPLSDVRTYLFLFFLCTLSIIRM